MIDDFLEEFARRLRLPRRGRRRVLEEVREHLEDAVAARGAEGLDASSAVQQAVRAFGAPADLAAQLNAQSATTTMRRTPMLFVGCGVAVIGGFLLAATHNRSTASTTAPALAQASFFLATLGAQVALVAGARAVSLVAARWRNDIVPASERELVRACNLIGAVALVVTALGWSVAVLFALDRGHLARPAAAVGGVFVMMSAASVAVAAAARRSFADATDPQFQEPADGIPLRSAGERLIEQIRRHPVLACSATATASALTAMSHAETSVPAALIWGSIEAIAVVAGFILLGPWLVLDAAAPPATEA